ncbi:MAG: flagellar hook-associated protein FlgK [Deltaproteobacteria bacterium]|nr:flagellar hook-associated protein FlgK [Deltaproteobacteria bacterium]
MSGITAILDIAARSLLAAQLGVEVSSNNVSNVNTPGYCRQRVLLETTYPVVSDFGPLGRGVQVGGIERAFDPFITARLDEKTCTLSELKARLEVLERLASLFNETQNQGMNDILSSFWGAWGDLADNPAGSGERQALLQQAVNLCQAFNLRADQLSRERLALTQQIRPVLTQINDLSARIAGLTQEITETEANGKTANDLRDQRQLAIHQLSQLVGVRCYTVGDGVVNVTLNNGLPLVQGIMAFELDFHITPADTVAVLWKGPGGVEENITGELSGGKLAGLVQGRDQIIPRYQEMLDNLARDMIFAVNARHSQGVGLRFFSDATGAYAVNGAADPLNAAGLPFGDRITTGSFQIHVDRDGAHLASGTINVTPTMTLNDLVNAINTHAAIGPYVTASIDGNRLKIDANLASDSFAFAQDTSNLLASLGVNTFFTGDKAYTLAVNPWVSESPDLIAAGLIDPLTGAHAVGDNRNALLLADLEDAAVTADGRTIGQALLQMVTDLGLQTEQTGRNRQFFQDLVEQLTRLRDSVSAVSLDEEMTNLIKFQRAYQAAARLVTVAEEMYRTLLTLKQ